MKNLLNLKKAHVLSKKEQQTINGGGLQCNSNNYGRRCNTQGHICCGPGLCLPENDPQCLR